MMHVRPHRHHSSLGFLKLVGPTIRELVQDQQVFSTFRSTSKFRCSGDAFQKWKCFETPLRGPGPLPVTFHTNPQHFDIEKPGNLSTEDASPLPMHLPLPFQSRRAYVKVILAIDAAAFTGDWTDPGWYRFFANPVSPRLPPSVLFVAFIFFL